MDELIDRVWAHYGEAVMDVGDVVGEDLVGWTSLLLAEPARNGVGGWVKAMIASGDLGGWQDVNIVRVAIGL